MSKNYLWKIGGEAGFGIMTTGLMFSKIAARHGYHIYDYFEYPSLIRGGHNTTETLVSDEEVFSTKNHVDLLVCLNKQTFELHKHRLAKDSIVVYDSEAFVIDSGDYTLVDLPFKKILTQHEAPIVMMNNVALGASLAIMGWDLQILNSMIELQFAKKGAEVIEKNKIMAQFGFDHITKNVPNTIHNLFLTKKEEEKLILTGNDAFALGAIVADCRLYSAYPMTPSSTILSTLAGYAEKTGMIVRHAEDEIAVINTALGSSFAGVRSACGSSGGGFALMVEALSFAGIAEIPIVVFLGQRPGPATGLPTWTEQGDLLFAVNAGHGEFPKIILAPGDVEEMYAMTAEAFDLADIYQTPVIVMSDKLLAESHKSSSSVTFKLWSKGYKPERGKITGQITNDQLSITNGKYHRYALAEDGISPMLIPGASGQFYQANSYEHVEDGHTTEDATPRVQQVDKRAKKMQTYLTNHFKMPTIYGGIEKASTVIVSWGGNKGAIQEAMKEMGTDVAYIHFTHLYPLDEAKIKALFSKQKKYILIENNSRGQFGLLLRELTGVHIEMRLLRYDGRPIWKEEIINYVNNN